MCIYFDVINRPHLLCILCAPWMMHSQQTSTMTHTLHMSAPTHKLSTPQPKWSLHKLQTTHRPHIQIRTLSCPESTVALLNDVRQSGNTASAGQGSDWVARGGGRGKRTVCQTNAGTRKHYVPHVFQRSTAGWKLQQDECKSFVLHTDFMTGTVTREGGIFAQLQIRKVTGEQTVWGFHDIKEGYLAMMLDPFVQVQEKWLNLWLLLNDANSTSVSHEDVYCHTSLLLLSHQSNIAISEMQKFLFNLRFDSLIMEKADFIGPNLCAFAPSLVQEGNLTYFLHRYATRFVPNFKRLSIAISKFLFTNTSAQFINVTDELIGKRPAMNRDKTM